MRLLAVLLVGVASVDAQATDWCPYLGQHPDFYRYANLSTMLAGQTLKVVAFHEPPWSAINLSLPMGVGEGKRISGFEPALMLKIAEEGQFNVEYDYAFPAEGQSWTDALVDVKDKYDLVAGGGWMDTAVRRNRGVTFTSSINNHGIVLAMKTPVPKPPGLWENAFFFLKPFTGAAYAMAAAMAMVPAFLIWLLERKRQRGLQGALESQYMGILAIMGWGDFTWANSWFSRFIMANWGLMCLILVSSYTASLTNFLISEDRPKLAASGASDFLKKGFTVCIPEGYGAVSVMRTKWEKYNKQLLEVPPAELTKKLAEEGTCTGILLQHDYLRIMLRGGAPSTVPPVGVPHYGCGAEMVGPTEITGVGAFPAGNSQCRWFVIQIIDSIIRRLSEQQIVETMYLSAVSRGTRDEFGKPLCQVKQQEDPPEIRLTAEHLVGLVVIVLPAIVFITAVETVLRKVNGREVGLDETSLSPEMQELEKGLHAAQVMQVGAKKLSTRMSFRQKRGSNSDIEFKVADDLADTQS
eukprot:Hpha_TRINITY_DN1794_c0_g1::TRINITY_DN1794_c0_g1_i1::g.158400::m.158400